MAVKKRGLSRVLAIVLISLLAIAAAGIIWASLRPVFEENAEKIEARQQSLTTSFVIQNYELNETSKEVNVNVKRNPGQGEVIGFVITLEDVNGNIQSFRQETPLNELESKSLRIDYAQTNLGDIAIIGITPIFNINGKDVVGESVVSKTIPGRQVTRTGGGSGGGNGGGDGGDGDKGGGQKEYCVDGDDNLDLNKQAPTASLVIYLIDNCDNKAENKEDCMYVVSAADVCLNQGTLAEQTCNKDKHEVKNIDCPSGCLQGRCSEAAQ